MIGADERAAMEETVRAAISAAGGREAVDRVLGELGWLDLLDTEPGDAIGIVFTALGAKPRPDLAVLLPPFAAWAPPGRSGLATARVATARELLVVCGTAEEPAVCTVATADADVRAVHGIDPDAGLHLVSVRADAAAPERLDAAAWRSAIALGRRAVAHQIAGALRAMLALARTHATERVQFGRPIARFQAVRHRLADALVAVEALEAALGAAHDEPNPDTAALAKALAGRSAHKVAAHCQQVLAGIGFTTEHPFHRYLKRTLALEGLFGSADAIVLALGRQLLSTRRVPTLIEL